MHLENLMGDFSFQFCMFIAYFIDRLANMIYFVIMFHSDNARNVVGFVIVHGLWNQMVT